MRRRPKTLLVTVACCACVHAAAAVRAAQSAPAGAWRTTNECFLAVFILADGGRAAAAYLSGERDENATWTWDGDALRITSTKFPLDRFTGRFADERVEADYVWHDFDRDVLNRQSCLFERVMPSAG